MGFSQSDTVQYSRRSVWKGVAIFAVDTSILIACAWLAIFSDFLWLRLFASVGTGLMIALLFVVGHDAAHQSLTPHRWLNGMLGRLAFLPSLHPFSLWQLGHNQTHHRWTNLSTKDYVWTPLSMAQFQALSPRRRMVYRFHRSLLGPLTYYLTEIWWPKMVCPSSQVVNGDYKREYIFDLVLVYSFLAAYTITLASLATQLAPSRGLGAFDVFLFGVLIPFAVWNVLMGFVVYLHHTHPHIRWYDNQADWRSCSAQYSSAVHVIFPRPVNFVFHRIMEHNAHHERPSIPLYQLKAAQENLHEDIYVLEWNPFSHLAIVKACKLYDFEQARWLDFSGNYTSESTQITRDIPEPHFASRKEARQSPTANPFVQN